MRILPKVLVFEWDEGNKTNNEVKHKVTIKEAEQVFFCDELFIFEDEKHSVTEVRYGLLGETKNKKRLAITFTIRQNRIRIITARNMSRRERRSYEKIKKDSKI